MTHLTETFDFRFFVILTLGCSQARPPLLTPPEPPIVWPAAPDSPRIRYLGEIKGSQDLKSQKTIGQMFDELVHGPVPPSPLVTPYAVAVHADGDRVAVADTGAAHVHVFNLRTQVYERKESCGSPARHFESPVAVAWLGDDLWIADARLHALAVFGSGGDQRWLGEDALQRPSGMAFCPVNELIYVADAGAQAILAFDRDGRIAQRFGSRGAGPGQFNCPAQLTCVGDDLFVVDSLNARVQRLGLDGTPLGSFGTKGDAAGDLALPKGIAAGPDQTLWVVDAQFENIQAFTTDGKLLMAFGQEGHGPGEFWLPAGLCTDSRQRLWVADSYNRRVQVFGWIE